METAILMHNVYRLPVELDMRTEKLCHVLRDADKIDILGVNVEVPLEEIYNTTIEDVQNAVVTEAVMDNFFTHRATPRQIKKSSIDHLVGHISLVYELVFSESLRIVKMTVIWTSCCILRAGTRRHRSNLMFCDERWNTIYRSMHRRELCISTL